MSFIEFARRKGSKDKVKRKKRSLRTLLTNPYEAVRQREENLAKVSKKSVQRQTFDPDRQALAGSIGGALSGGLYGGLAGTLLATTRINRKIKKGGLKKISSRLKSDPVALNKVLSYVGRNAKKGAVAGALGFGAYQAVKNYRQAKKANDDYGLRYEYSHGDYLSEFARKKGSKDKVKRRRRRILNTLTNVAAAGIGGGLGSYLGLKAVNNEFENNPNLKKQIDTVRYNLEQVSDRRFQAKKRQMMSDLQGDVVAARNRANRGDKLLPGKGFNASVSIEDELHEMAYKRGQKLGRYAVRQNNAINQIVRKQKAIPRYVYGGYGAVLGAAVGLSAIGAYKDRRRRVKK